MTVEWDPSIPDLQNTHKITKRYNLAMKDFNERLAANIGGKILSIKPLTEADSHGDQVFGCETFGD
jgi:hypothetical protein